MGGVPDSPDAAVPHDLPRPHAPKSRETQAETTLVETAAGIGKVPEPRGRILSSDFTKMLGELYPPNDWQFELPAGASSMISDIVKLHEPLTGISNELAGLVPTSPILEDLLVSPPLWMDTAFRISAEIESLFPSPVIPQALVNSLVVSHPAFNLSSSTFAAINSLSASLPILTAPAWFDPIITQSETFRSAAELASLGKLHDFPADLLGTLRFLDLPPLAASKRHLPSNWRSVDLDPDEIETEVRAILEEGIPLAWIPAPRVIDLLLDAPDAAARRRVILNNHRGILTSCEQLAGRLSSPRALHYADMLRKSVRSLRDGHVEAAQALASILLDTIVSNHTRDAVGLTMGSLTNASAYTVTRKRGWRHTLALHPLTVVMSRGTHTAKNPTRRYNRNATVHAMGLLHG